ncbi:MAG: sugar transferase [Acidobacteriota bacterium]
MNAKRSFDFLVAFAGLVILAPALLLIACVIFAEDRRSPFFFGTRVARNGGEFRMLKFRSMVPGAWKTGVSSTASTDQRITSTGAFLRRFKLDEFPQLWNVVVGDMSLVGPRPQVSTDARMYTSEERRLLTARPGITDLASIVFADEGEILADSADPDLLYNQIIRPWKSRLGLLYIDQHTLSVDVRILALTLFSAISRPRALAGVAHILESWHADPILLRAASRQHPLLPWPPPGADEVVQKYPTQAAHA